MSITAICKAGGQHIRPVWALKTINLTLIGVRLWSAGTEKTVMEMAGLENRSSLGKKSTHGERVWFVTENPSPNRKGYYLEQSVRVFILVNHLRGCIFLQNVCRTSRRWLKSPASSTCRSWENVSKPVVKKHLLIQFCTTDIRATGHEPINFVRVLLLD